MKPFAISLLACSCLALPAFGGVFAVGTVDEAFFGPRGAEIGGVYQLAGDSGLFVATKGP